MLETKVSLQGVKRNEWLNLRKTGLGAYCEAKRPSLRSKTAAFRF